MNEKLKNRFYCNGKLYVKETKDAADILKDKEFEREFHAKDKKPTKTKLAEIRRNRKFNIRVKEAVFSYLKSIGYDVYDVVTGNGYFIFDMGDESVVHFKIRGRWLRKYQFGMWINAKKFNNKPFNEMTKSEMKKFESLSSSEKESYNTVVEIFQQHEDYLDKFKPSRSAPVVEICRDDVSDMLKRVASKKSDESFKTECNGGYGFDISKLRELLKFMQKHPFLHFAGLLEHGDYLVNCINGRQLSHPFMWFLKERIRFRTEHALIALKKWFGMRRTMSALKGLAKEKCVKSIVMTNFSNVVMEGCSTSYEYEVKIRFTKDSTVKECSDAFDRHIPSLKLGQYDKYDCIAEIEPRYGMFKDADYEDEHGEYHDELNLIDWFGHDDELDTYRNMFKWYENAKSWCKSKKESKEFVKKFPTIIEYAKKRHYDMYRKCHLRAVGYLKDSMYEIVEEQTESNHWERLV